MTTITGTDNKDFLFGTAGADVIDGGKGNDTMTGYGGNDTYYVEDFDDKVVEATGEGTDTVISSVNYQLTDNVEKLILTGTAEQGFGNDLDNTITGNDSKNTLLGGLGKDTMTGGKGDDIYYVDNVGDKVVETLSQAQGGGIDLVHSAVSFSAAGNINIENIWLQGSQDLTATGNASDNWLNGSAGNDTLSGGAGNDTLTDGFGNDVLDGGTGDDVMKGGDGNDTYKVDSLGDKVQEFNLGGTADTIISTIALSGPVAYVEHYIFQTKTALDFTGSAGSEVIEGGSGNDVIHGGGGYDRLVGGAGSDQLFGGDLGDTLNGGAGVDVMKGGDGNDTYFVDNKMDLVVENGTVGAGLFDTIITSISLELAANVEYCGVVNGTAAINITGNDLDNNMTGNDGANIIDGGKGADTMYGLAGSDTYIVDDAGDIAVEGNDLGKSTDLVKSSVDYTLGNYIENLTLTGTATKGVGNTENNIITGNDEGNFLDGGAGNDTLIGGKGDDYYVVDSSGDKIVETLSQANGGGIDAVESAIDFSLAALGNVEMLQLTGTAVKAIGNALDNTLYGDAVGNWLDGGKGADVMAGGDGNDTYVMDNAGDKIAETGGAGDTHDHLISTIALISGVQGVEDYTFNTNAAVHFAGDGGNNIITGGSGADILNGGGGIDTLIGGAGNDSLITGGGADTLDGGKGADVMAGGNGSDVYQVDNVGDKVEESNGLLSGSDTVFSTVSIDLLYDNVENLQLQGTTALHATGNGLDNLLAGNDANNILDGGAGADILYGHKGNDTLTGGSGGDTFFFYLSVPGNEGHDTVTDFVKAEDVLSFNVGDYNNDNTIDLNDLLDSCSVIDHGAGQAVDVTFADGGVISFAGAGTGNVNSIDDLVANAATQIHVQ